jgi:cytidylate kinase
MGSRTARFIRSTLPDATRASKVVPRRGVGHDARPMAAPLVVVIDGPAGAGKSTVARNLARALSLPLLDTGAIYRTLAWVARERGVDWDDERGLAELTTDLPLRFLQSDDGGPQRVELDGRDVTADIRRPEISEGASRVSAHPRVRAGLLAIQRALAVHGCVAEGRDMGTVVFPDADFKFFLTADLDARVRRRQAELAGASEAEVRADMERRDARDSSREASPLRRAPDAIDIDSSGMSADAVTAHMLSLIRG